MNALPGLYRVIGDCAYSMPSEKIVPIYRGAGWYDNFNFYASQLLNQTRNGIRLNDEEMGNSFTSVVNKNEAYETSYGMNCYASQLLDQ